MLNTLRSEFTKLRTTRSFWWTTGLVFVISFGWALLNTKMAEDGLNGAQSINSAALGAIVQLLGIPILMIQAIMVVTTEYRYGVQTPTYLATPKRWTVALAKLIMYAVIAAAITFVAIVGSFFIADQLASGLAGDLFDPFGSDDGKRALWTYPLGAALAVLFTQGLGLLLRQTAGTVAISLILFLGLDQLISFLPKVGDKITHFSPFGALQKFLSNYAPGDAPWGDNVTAYLWVFVAWAVILWVLGVIALSKRDA